MIKKRMQDAINKQINEEMFSGYFYLGMSAYFESADLKGFAYWFKTQVQEEFFHMMKFYNHVLDRGGSVELDALAKPDQKWDSPLQLFEEALKHENHITACINKLMDIAIEEKDHAARNMLNWFVDEQVEEEDTFNELVSKLKMIGDNKAMLLMFDQEMFQRKQGENPFFPTAAE